MTLLSKKPALIDSSLESSNWGAHQTHVEWSQNVLHSVTLAGMMTFPACYQHIPKGRYFGPGQASFPQQYPLSAETDRLFTSAAENAAAHLPVDERKEIPGELQERVTPGGFLYIHTALTQVLGCCSPGILLFIECYRWLRGQEALPSLNSALGTAEAWKAPSSSFQAASPNPHWEEKRERNKGRERKKKTV